MSWTSTLSTEGGVATMSYVFRQTNETGMTVYPGDQIMQTQIRGVWHWAVIRDGQWLIGNRVNNGEEEEAESKRQKEEKKRPA